MNPLQDLPDNWQHEDVRAALQFVKRRKLALDIGAHRGVITRLLVDEFEEVVAYEPTDLVHQITDRATRVQVALGARQVEVIMCHGRHNTGQTFVHPSPGLTIVDVEGVPAVMNTLDNLEWSSAPDFIKIDVEGMEYEVLRGGETMIRSVRPVIMLEVNGLSRRYFRDPMDACRLLESWGARLLTVLRSNYPDEDHVYGW